MFEDDDFTDADIYDILYKQYLKDQKEDLDNSKEENDESDETEDDLINED